MQNKFLILFVFFIGLAAFLFISQKNFDSGLNKSNQSSVSMENGVQKIRITARGGYKPNLIKAKPSTPTILEFETAGTYDCSLALVIPKIDYRGVLPATGVTEVKIPENQAIGDLDFLCSMGMYRGKIVFET
jgi:Cu+-exporting ATPase